MSVVKCKEKNFLLPYSTNGKKVSVVKCKEFFDMPDRTRPIRKEICLNEQELSVVRHKMNQLGTNNFGAYACKMLIDGYIIKVDYTEQKKLAAAVSRIATNINHVCRRINSTGHFYDADVAELKERQAEIWELLKVRQRDEL